MILTYVNLVLIWFEDMSLIRFEFGVMISTLFYNAFDMVRLVVYIGMVLQVVYDALIWFGNGAPFSGFPMGWLQKGKPKQPGTGVWSISRWFLWFWYEFNMVLIRFWYDFDTIVTGWTCVFPSWAQTIEESAFPHLANVSTCMELASKTPSKSQCWPRSRIITQLKHTETILK